MVQTCTKKRTLTGVRVRREVSKLLNLVLANSSPKPIYEQIISQIEAAIAQGQLKPGDQLPSIRALANDLGISVITTKRAYNDLEATGLIESVQGKGCFVSDAGSKSLSQRQKARVEEALDTALSLASAAGIDDAELLTMLQQRMNS